MRGVSTASTWDFAYDGVSDVVDQCVAYLRREIDEPGGAAAHPLKLLNRAGGPPVTGPDGRR